METSHLKFFNDKLYSLSQDRIQLKKELNTLQLTNAGNDRYINDIELKYEVEIYINDIEKKYNNEQARKTGIKLLLSSDLEYQRISNCIINNTIAINEIEFKLMSNQSHIDFNKRAYDINILSIKESN